MKRADLIVTAILVPVDFLMLMLAGVFSYFIRTEWLADFRPVLFSLDLPFSRYLVLLVIVSAFWLSAFALIGLYNMRFTPRLFEESSRVVIASCAALVGLTVYIFLKSDLFNSRFIVLASWALGIFFVTFGRFLVRKMQRYLLLRHEIGAQKIILVGVDRAINNLKKEIERRPSLGYRIKKHLLDLDLERIKNSLKNPGIDEIILGNSPFSKKRILELISFCEDKKIALRFVPNLFQTLTANVGIETLGSVPLLEIKKTSLEGWGKIFKRSFDFILSLIGLIIICPILIIIGFMIKWDSSGPVFFTDMRVRQDKKFYLYKFRSMVKNASYYRKYLAPLNEREQGPLFKIKDDPRITKIGRFLRRSRLDELPQLFNVLKGEMSLVGPRPHQPNEVAQYQRHHRRLLAIKPGITGMAQISGSSDLSFEEEVRLDTYYIENWNLLLDLKIIFKTLFVLFTDKSAC